MADPSGSPVDAQKVARLRDEAAAAARAGRDALAAQIAQHAGIALLTLEEHVADLTICWVNDSFTRTTGYSPDEVAGQSLRVFYQHRWSESAFQDISARVARGELVEITLPFLRRGGGDLWLRVSIRRLPSRAAGPAQWVCTATDVTDQVEHSVSQLASIESERRTHSIFAALSQVSDILGDSDHPEVLTEIALLLAELVVRWAGFFLVDDGMRLVAGIDPAVAIGAGGRPSASSGPDPVRDLLAGRAAATADLDLDAVYEPGSASAQVQDQILRALEEQAAVERAAGTGSAAGGDATGTDGETADQDQVPECARRVVLSALPGGRRIVGVLAALPWHDGGVDGLDDQERTVLEVVSRRVGLAVENVRLYAREHTLAETLQRSMLPEQADVQGLDLWTYYSPNSGHAQVGGDWYDILEIAPGLAGLVVGDVVGHDVEAAAVMGQLRSIVRSYAYEVVEPGPVLDRVDRLLTGMRIPRAASLVYATMAHAESGWSLSYTRAGHLPPLLLRDGRVVQLVDAGGPLVGFGNRPRTAGRCELRPGDALILYTDGLIERRDRDLRAGLGSLVHVAERIAARDAAGIGEELLARLAEAPEDDVAVVIVRIPRADGDEGAGRGSPRSRRWSLPSEPASIARARHLVLRTCQAWELGNLANSELVVSELTANAVLHGWGTVSLRLFDTGDGLRIEVEDSNPAPPVATQGHANGVGGYGIQIVDRLADWGWRPTRSGKIVWARLRNSSS